MGKTYDEITPELSGWIAAQRMFFVASAPLAESGHVNCSPKGGDSFRVIGPREVAYVDLTGSGIETVAHVRENGRIVVMFCAFEGGPKIVRLHGRGEVIEPGHGKFNALKAHFPTLPGLRAIIRIAVTRISDSCGYAVPRYDYVEPRDVLDQWAEAKGEEGLTTYRAQKNRTSLDGLPALRNP
ncbi:MAG: pyridoxamine 5'-phosphate oxidase family protein [Opitutaceae bacterium]|jgi:hypothetical protein|nr:pyridoxamine 5'-phosphate oxidase family protein [Opitutaceae bacterium]